MPMADIPRLRQQLDRWIEANPADNLVGVTCHVKRLASGKKSVGFPGQWKHLEAPPEGDEWWAGNTLAIVIPPNWVAVDIDKPSAAAEHIDIGRLKALSDCRYGTSVDDDGGRRGHIWFRLPDGEANPYERRLDKAGQDALGVDILSGATNSVAFIAGPGRDEPRSYTPAPLTAEVRAIIDACLDLAPEAKTGPVEPSGNAGMADSAELGPDAIQGLLDRIGPAGLGRDEWLKVGMAVHAWDPSVLGYALWDGWNQRDPGRYKAGENEAQWRSFNLAGRGGRAVTVGTLVHMAGGWPQEVKVKAKKAKSKKVKSKAKTGGEVDGRWVVPGDWSQRNYWATGRSLEMCLAHLGWAIRRNSRSTKIEVLDIGPQADPREFVESLGPRGVHDPGNPGWAAMGLGQGEWFVSEIFNKCSAARQVKDDDGETRFVPYAVEYRPGRGYLSFGQAVTAAVYPRSHDAVKYWLEALPAHDGIPRHMTLLMSALGIAQSDTGLAEDAARALLVGAVRRTFRPGAKHDQAVILSGATGLGKSSLMQLLVPSPDWHVRGINPSSDDKVLIERCGNAVFAELSELASHRIASVEAAKDAMSAQYLKARLAYGQEAVDHPVRHVYYATTNRPDPLPQDDALARRFVPIFVTGHPEGVGSVYDRIKNLMESMQRSGSTYREQIWAEALAAYKAGADSYIPEHLYIDRAKALAHVDPAYEGAMRSWLAANGDKAGHPIAYSALAGAVADWLAKTAGRSGDAKVAVTMDRVVSKRLADALRFLGFRDDRVKGRRVWFVPPAHAIPEPAFGEEVAPIYDF